MEVITVQHFGGLIWNLFMAVVGITAVVTGPKYLHLIDEGFPDKKLRNPEAAAKQVKTFRILGAALALCGLSLMFFEVLRIGK